MILACEYGPSDEGVGCIRRLLIIWKLGEGVIQQLKT